MKKYVLLSFLGLLIGCDDGDILIENVDFDEVSLEVCASTPAERLANTFFFKIQDDEALLLTMAANQIRNATSLDRSLTTTITASGAPQLIYRLYTGSITRSFFCDVIQPVSPTVAQESVAAGGNITVTSLVSTVSRTNKTYAHTIEINDLSLTNEIGERLTDRPTLDFGNFTTDTATSALLEVPFSNYSTILLAACEPAISADRTTLYKINNDEFISLELPNSLIENMATGDTPRVTDFETEIIFKNTILNQLATNGLVCAANMDATTLKGSFSSSEGTISVSTAASVPDANGVITYTHSILLTDVILSFSSATSTTAVTLESIATIDLGNFTTTGP
ncbi:MAG: hypothetical protein WA810_04785 [Maribacter sp.]